MLGPSLTKAPCSKPHISVPVCHTNNKVSTCFPDILSLTFHSLHDDTQDSETIAWNIENLGTFALKDLEEIVEMEKEMFGSTSLEVFAHVNLGLIFNKAKGRYEWMVNEVEQMPNASLWVLDKADIDSDIPKVIARNLSDYLCSDRMACTWCQLYTSQANCWWKKPSILLEYISSVSSI
jgi:hypothetical protein